MPTLRLYPTAVLQGQSFTTATLANVVGNTTSYAIHTGTIGTGTGYGGTFTFQFSQLPVDIGSISKIESGVIARCNLANSRQAYSFECFNGSTLIYKTQPTNTTNRLATADATFLANTDLANGVFNTNVALWRDDNIQVNYTFIGIANPGSSLTTSWQKFWLDITYELAPAAGPASLLFLGENF